MPKFRVIVTRDTTESAFITVEADDEEQANERALERAETAEKIGGPNLGYERDDCSQSDPYVTGCDEEEDDA